MFNITSANFDLLSVGIATAGIALLGFVIYYNDKESSTNRTFLIFSIITAIWGVSNYSEYQFHNIANALWALRLHLFISTIHALFFFQLAYVFPSKSIRFPKWYIFGVVPVASATAILTLSPIVFSGISHPIVSGQVTNPDRGPGIAIFALVAFGLLFSGIGALIRKTFKSHALERRQTILILFGMTLTACLILLFNVVLPVVLNNLGFIPLAALFLFPFIGLTSYSIFRYRLFNLRLATTAFVAFLVTIFSFANIIFSTTPVEVLVNSTAFLIILIGSIELVRSVIREHKQREELEIANQGQTNLIHIINHQIKGYLAKSRNIFAELLDGGYGAVSNEMKPMLDEGLKSLSEGVDFVQQVLNSSSAEKGTLAYVMEAIDFKNVVEEMYEHEKPEAAEKNLALELKVDDGDYKTKGDFVQLKEAVRNLISNSVIYTPSGSVRVHLTHKENKILLTVTDTGVGLSDEDKQRLFTKGGRGKDSLKVNVNSTGYGLSFVKAVIEAHKGRVWADSEGRGKGSTFSIELPE